MRVPATFTLLPTGRLEPPTISVPAFIAVQVSVVARDHRPHHVLLRTPVPHRLVVPRGGRASLLIRGQRAGAYVVVVDGRVRGSLAVGGEPGP